jgi:transcriptional regulator of acetoin/glycerol metabolism
MPLLTKEEILEALQICEGNRSKAAKYLSVGRRTLYRYIDRFGIGDKFGKKS